MKNSLIRPLRTAIERMTREAGEKLLLLFSALLSLAFVAYFLVTIETTHVAATNGVPPSIKEAVTITEQAAATPDKYQKLIPHCRRQITPPQRQARIGKSGSG